MSKLTQTQVETILDILYTDSGKSNQTCFKHIAKLTNLSYPVVRKVVSVLQDMNVLSVTGERRQTSYRWSHDKAHANPSMARKVLEVYSDFKPASSTPKLSTEICIAYLQRKGWNGTLTKSYKDGYVMHTETIEIGE